MYQKEDMEEVAVILATEMVVHAFFTHEVKKEKGANSILCLGL